MAEFERELLARRRDHLILRVDRADLSKNVLRGFTAFDIFLEQHPEFSERVTFIAQLMPSRTDVPEYAEYLERIEALVAVVNHRHGTTDWMPIHLKLRDDLEEAVAAYKHYDVLLVNAMFDGMNLVAKEGPLVNEHDGVSILSENTGAHEELGEFALSVNPFDVQELADSIHAALTMDPAERAAARARAQGHRDRPRPRRLDRRAAGRHPQEGAGADAVGPVRGSGLAGAAQPGANSPAGGGAGPGVRARGGLGVGGRADPRRGLATAGAGAGARRPALEPGAGAGRDRAGCLRSVRRGGRGRRLRRAAGPTRSGTPAPAREGVAGGRGAGGGAGGSPPTAAGGGGSAGARPPRRGHTTTSPAAARTASVHATFDQRMRSRTGSYRSVPCPTPG